MSETAPVGGPMTGPPPPASTELVTEVLSTGISRLAVNAVVITSVLTALATVLAVVRFWLRRKNALGTDDYVLMASLPFLQLQLAFVFMIGFLSGSGWEMQDLITRPDRITWIFKLIYFPELSYTVVITLLKTSILYSYKRIFGKNKTTKIIIYILLGLTWIWGVVFFFIIIFQCDPIDKFWYPMKPGHCIPIIPFLWGNSISNFILDWMILLVPVVPVLKLQLPMKQKVLVGLSFMFGSLACIASTIRGAKTAEFDPANLGIADYEASIWVYIEAPLATISCCLPFLGRILGVKALNMVQRFTSRMSSKGTSQASSHMASGNRYKEASATESHVGWTSRETTSHGGEHHAYPQDNTGIQLTTSMSVRSHVVNHQEAEKISHDYTTFPAAALPRNESTHTLV